MSVEILYETEVLGRSVSVASRRTDTAELVRQARHDRAEVVGTFLGQLLGDSLFPLGEGLKKVARTVESWRQRRATFGELSALDDRLLADIGVRRADIPAIAEASGNRRGLARVNSAASMLSRSV